MRPHLRFCSDLARRDPSGRTITRVEGWCFGSAPITGLYLHRSGREYERVPHGAARPDVAQVHPTYPNALRSGFGVSTDHEIAAGAPSYFAVHIAGENGAEEVHRVPLQLETRAIQTVQLDEHTQRAAAPDAATLLDGTVNESNWRRALEKRPGLTLRLDIINKCNLRCVMCHFSDDQIFKRPVRQLTDTEFTQLFEDVGPFVSHVMLSCGDEPLLSKFLANILRYLHERHPHVAIEFCTNAMLMNERIRDLIMETRVARLLFSIDAVSKPLLESIRVGCRYEQLLGNIIALRDLKAKHGSASPAFVFNFVMMNRNIHEAPAFAEVAHALGAAEVDFRHVVPMANYVDPEEMLSAHPAKYNYYRSQIVAATDALGLKRYLPPAFETSEQWAPTNEPEVNLSDFRRVAQSYEVIPLPGIRNGVAHRAPEGEGTLAEQFASTFCHRPFSEIMIRDQEEVLPCPWHGKVLGRLSAGTTLREIFFGPEFTQLRKNMFNAAGDTGCANCPVRSGHLPVEG